VPPANSGFHIPPPALIIAADSLYRIVRMGYFRPSVEKTEGYVPGFQPAAADVVKLNTNENPYPPSPQVMAAIASVKPEQLRRYPDPLANKFRQAAAKLHAVEVDNIICVNGGDELLSMAVRAFCDASRGLAYPVPTYTLYAVLAGLTGCPVVEVPFDDEFNLPAKLANTGAALTIVCNPNAPSGTLVPFGELRSLADELKGRSALLIDEAYVDFAPRDCVQLVRDFNNVVILRTLSKGYSLAGLRFGYGIADAGLIAGLMKVKDSYNTDAIVIEAATAAIGDQAWFRQNLEKIKAERTRLVGELRAMGMRVHDSHSNFVLAEVRGISARQVYEQLASQNIYVRYFAGLGEKLRISVGTPEQNSRLLQALERILQGCRP
jgi:histidinol-phosphate aminotransferase